MTENMRLVDEAGQPMGQPERPMHMRPIVEQAHDRIRQCQKEIEKQEAVVRFMQENPGLQDKIDALNKLFF